MTPLYCLVFKMMLIFHEPIMSNSFLLYISNTVSWWKVIWKPSLKSVHSHEPVINVSNQRRHADGILSERTKHIENEPSLLQETLVENTILTAGESLSVEARPVHNDEDTTQELSSPKGHISHHLVSTLDLAPLMTHVADYACTKRGKQAVLSLVSLPTNSAASSRFDTGRKRRKPSLLGYESLRTKRQEWFLDKSTFSWKSIPRDGRYTNKSFANLFPIAQSAEEAMSEFELVRQGMDVFLSLVPRIDNIANHRVPIPLPPMFKLRDRLLRSTNNAVTSMISETDDDEWLEICLSPSTLEEDNIEEIHLEMIMQAEQVTKLLLDTYEWAKDKNVSSQVPEIASIIVKSMESSNSNRNDVISRDEEQDCGKNMTEYTITSSLSKLYTTINGVIEIVRAGPSLTDPNNRLSYRFQIVSGNGRFQELHLLRQKEEQCLQRIKKSRMSEVKDQNHIELALIREELLSLESQLKRRFIKEMIRAAPDVEFAFHALVRLDIILARAAFGCEWYGVIPLIGKEGRVNVKGFIHPVLALEKETVGKNFLRRVEPIDLLLPGKEFYQALIISGPNSGGKTLALKSFGLAAIMVQLALPIPQANTLKHHSIIVDFFGDIVVEVGDNQSIASGESTLMARLNVFSALLQKMSNSKSDSSSRLLLLDELGGGTDPIAGSAIAQSVLEKLLSVDPFCKIVVTTHSPQLKLLSLNDDRFQCASVLLDRLTRNNDIRQENVDTIHDTVVGYLTPTYQLRYGVTGESYALEAASRCSPSLPSDVIRRAAQLMTDEKSNQAGEVMHAHLKTLDRERQAAKVFKEEAEKVWREVCSCKDDTIKKLQVSDNYISRIESRLAAIFDTLQKDDSKSKYQLVGESLKDIRLVREKIKSEEELLSEKGLRRVKDTDLLYDGQSIVIIADGMWKGYSAVVKIVGSVSIERKYYSTVTVIPTLDLFASHEDEMTFLELKRTEIAIWDYPNEDFLGMSNQKNQELLRINNSGSRGSVQQLLSSLKTHTVNDHKGKAENGRLRDSFTSSRQRKAAIALTKKASRKNKGKKQ